MIKKNSLKRVAHYAGAFLLAGAAVGCGDDGGDGGGSDGGVDGAPCQGHGCVGIDSPFQLNEGGEIRLERLQQNADNSMQYLASQAFFFKGQTPGARDLGRPDLELLTQELVDQGYTCQDFRPGNLFDNGLSAAAQAVVDSREYYDVGETVTLTNKADPSDVITLSKRTDPTEAVDLSAGLTHDILYRGPDAQDVTLNTIYTPTIQGSLDYPVLDLQFGESVVGDEMADENGVGTPELYMPTAFTLTAPTEEEYFTPEFLTFTQGQDFEFKWESEPAPEGWPTIVPFVALLNADYQIVVNCVKTPTDAEPQPDNGTFLLPADALQFLDEIEPGPVLIGRFSHVAWEYRQDNTRMDLLGIECKLSPNWKLAPAN